MDKSLSKLHKNTKNLSPINRGNKKAFFSNARNKTENKEKISIDNKDKLANSVKITSNLNNNKNEKLNYPKNINEYRHIFCNFQTVKAEMSWLLDLRTNSEKINYKGLKNYRDTVPRLYAENIGEFKKKMMEEREHNKNKPGKGNFNQYSHLGADRVGVTANTSQFGFETALRGYKPKSDFLQASEWKAISSLQKPKLLSSYSNFDLNKSNNFLLNFLGEHKSLDKYSIKYTTKNINEIGHILSHNSNSVANFETGLRSYGVNVKDINSKFKDKNASPSSKLRE